MECPKMSKPILKSVDGRSDDSISLVIRLVNHKKGETKSVVQRKHRGLRKYKDLENMSSVR